MIYIIFPIFLQFFLIFTPIESAVQLRVRGDTSLVVGEKNLISGPGSPLISPITFPRNLTIDIVDSDNSLGSWEMFIEHVKLSWPKNTSLEAKRERRSSVIGGSVIGGENRFVTVRPSSNLFFTGSGGTEGVEVSYRIVGLNLSTLPGSYQSIVRFTLSEK